MVLSKVSLIFWIICCYPLCLDIMAQNYSDSEEEFTGFSTEDINITNNYVPNSDPESDLTVSSVHSEDISDLGEESGGESGTDEIGEAEWTQNFGESQLKISQSKVGQICLIHLILPWQHHLTILNLCSNQKCLKKL